MGMIRLIGKAWFWLTVSARRKVKYIFRDKFEEAGN